MGNSRWYVSSSAPCVTTDLDAECYYQWLKNTDTCKGTSLCWELDKFFAASRRSELSMSFLDDLREIAFCPSLITCTCSGGTLIHPNCRPAIGRLHASHEWSFDLSRPGALQDWTWRRLLEYYWHHAWPSPEANFPPLSTSATTSFKSNVLGPLHHPSRTAVHQGLTLTLLRHAPPKSNPRSQLRNKWIRYLCRGADSLPAVDQFPPFSPAVGTMVLDNQFDEEAALGLWGIFERCDIDICPCAGWAASGFSAPGTIADDETVSLRSINGVTVVFLSLVFLSLVAWEHRKVFCQSWRLQGIILSDLLRHGVGWLLFQHRDSYSMSISTQLFFQPLDLRDTNEGALMWSSVFEWLPPDPGDVFPSTWSEGRARALLLFRTWATRYATKGPIQDSLPRYLNVLRDMSPAWYEDFDWQVHDAHVRFTSSCGLALGTGVALVVERFEQMLGSDLPDGVHTLRAQVADFFREYFDTAVRTSGRRTRPFNGLVSLRHWSLHPELRRLGTTFDSEWHDFLHRMDASNQVRWENRSALMRHFCTAFLDALLAQVDLDEYWRDTARIVRSNLASPVSIQLVPGADRNQLLTFHNAQGADLSADFAAKFMIGLNEKWADRWDGEPSEMRETVPQADAGDPPSEASITELKNEDPDPDGPNPPPPSDKPGRAGPHQLWISVVLAFLALVIAFSQGRLGNLSPGHLRTLTPDPAQLISTGHIVARYEAGSSLVLSIGDRVNVLEQPVPGWVKVRTDTGSVAVSSCTGHS